MSKTAKLQKGENVTAIIVQISFKITIIQNIV